MAKNQTRSDATNLSGVIKLSNQCQSLGVGLTSFFFLSIQQRNLLCDSQFVNIAFFLLFTRKQYEQYIIWVAREKIANQSLGALWRKVTKSKSSPTHGQTNQ